LIKDGDPNVGAAETVSGDFLAHLDPRPPEMITFIVSSARGINDHGIGALGSIAAWRISGSITSAFRT
jgi:hypothetical protein